MKKAILIEWPFIFSGVFLYYNAIQSLSPVRRRKSQFLIINSFMAGIVYAFIVQR